jgi:hypothetical protein
LQLPNCSVSLFVCIVLCAVFRLIVVLFCVMCVTCLLCLIVNHCHRVKTHLQLINITLYYITLHLSPILEFISRSNLVKPSSGLEKEFMLHVICGIYFGTKFKFQISLFLLLKKIYQSVILYHWAPMCQIYIKYATYCAISE